jgi:hypothetical protein
VVGSYVVPQMKLMSIATSLVNVSTKIEKKRLIHYHEDVDWENILLLK